MAGSINRPEWDVIVIGSGAGGATVARELSGAGIKVLLLERGRDQRWIGNAVATAGFIDRLGMRQSREGLSIIRALTTGGSTLIYGAVATPPPAWLKTDYGIDLDKDAAAVQKELGVAPTPERLIGPGAGRIMQAANGLGIDWQPFPKFVNFDQCVADCADCMLGCRRGAKWTARRFIDLARGDGCTLYTGFKVRRVIVHNGRAVGVEGLWHRRPMTLFARTVVLSAGGLGTPMILQRSGIDNAGKHFFCDPMAFVYGVLDRRKVGQDAPNTAGTYQYHDSHGVFFADHTDPRLIFPMQLLTRGARHLPRWLKYGSTIGILAKIKDEPGGTIDADGSFSKPLTARDRDRLAWGGDMAAKILVAAGADRKSILPTAIRGAHPGGTAAIGRVVDRNLETAVKNLYACDASVFPRSLASPQVMTIVCLARRLARRLRLVLG